MTTKDIMFLSKRIQVATEDKKTQVAVSANDLISAYNSQESTIKGKNHQNKEVNTKIVATAFENGGLKIGLTIKDGELVLGDTSMSKTLFDDIKNTNGANKDTPYYITVTNGTSTDKKSGPKLAIARIAFQLENDEVKVTLVDPK